MTPHARAISRRPVPRADVRLAIVTLLVLMLAWGCAGRDVAAPKGIAQVQHDASAGFPELLEIRGGRLTAGDDPWQDLAGVGHGGERLERGRHGA